MVSHVISMWPFLMAIQPVVSRYTNAPNYAPESLYYFTGTLYEYAEKDDSDEFSVLVSSEKLSNQPDWVEVPENHIIKIQHGKMPALWAI